MSGGWDNSACSTCSAAPNTMWCWRKQEPGAPIQCGSALVCVIHLDDLADEELLPSRLDPSAALEDAADVVVKLPVHHVPLVIIVPVTRPAAWVCARVVRGEMKRGQVEFARFASPTREGPHGAGV